MNPPPHVPLPLSIDGSDASEEDLDLQMQRIEFVAMDDELQHHVADDVDLDANNDDVADLDAVDALFNWQQLLAHLAQQADAQPLEQQVDQPQVEHIQLAHAAAGEAALPGEYPTERENHGKIKLVIGFVAALVTMGVLGTVLFRPWEKKERNP